MNHIIMACAVWLLLLGQITTTGAEVPVFRFFNTQRGGHIYTISEMERDYIIDNLLHFNYEGVKFAVHNTQATGTCPVYRFFNTRTGIHLYTISQTERDYILQNLPHYNYEGVKFYVHAGQAVNTTPVYRFFNTVHGGHLYTISSAERDTLMNLPQWSYEGIKFYVLLYCYRAGDLYAVDSIAGKLFYVPATGPGGFAQGSPLGEPCRWNGEDQFTHVLTGNLAVMEIEVTRRMWQELRAVQTSLPNDPSDPGCSPTLDHPVQENDWYEAILFANLLSLTQGLTRCYYLDAAYTIPIDVTNYSGIDLMYCQFEANGYRLPCEGEWEYMCRAGTTTPFSVDVPAYNDFTCGDQSCTPGTLPALESVAVFCANHDGGCAPAGSQDANPWNIRDVHGNVFEWCWDWYADDGYPTGTATDFTGPASGTSRVIRGGFWYVNAAFLRSASRLSSSPDARNNGRGFRLVRTVPNP